jgi:23S rRNA (uracil1939-C5)-methyltransferase
VTRFRTRSRPGAARAGAVPQRREIEVAVEALGAGGDGLARDDDAAGGGRLFVPLALPGERWRVRVDRPVEGGHAAVPIERLGDGADRAEPPCPYFGTCGGCRLQHLPPSDYAAFKRDRVVAALARRGLGEVPVEPVRVAPLRSRRRLRLALVRDERRGGTVRLGYRRRASRAVVPVEVCPIARPELEALLGPLAAGLGRALEAPLPVELGLTLAGTGVDLLLHAQGRGPSLAEREALAALADSLDLARVAWAAGEGAAPEPVAERRRPAVRLGGVAVDLPAGAFLQATEFGEAELAAAVLAWAGEGTRSALDLYAGLGTLGLPLAAAGAVRLLHAVEVDPEAAAALRRAAAVLGLPVTVEARDLARRPLLGPELDRFDLVLVDPPRAGVAADQVRGLASSRVPRIVYASCDPGSFARDARVLVDGGYRLAAVRPIDQFLFSAEVELAARFERNVAAGAPGRS